MTEPIIVKAVYKFKGTNNDELKFKKGDLITITQKEEGGWWEGTLDGRTGWFPSNYVEETAGGAREEAGRESRREIQEEVIAKNIDYRQQVISDLLEKEQEFVSELRVLYNNYLQPLHHADIVSETEYKQLVGNIEELIESHQRLNSGLEDVRRCGPRHQRLGSVFLQHGAGLRAAHLTYWGNHPRAVVVLEQHREALDSWLTTCQGGAAGPGPPGLMVLTTGLSRPFRQLERLAGAIQEVAQHLEDDHADRGDTQRSIAFYKESAMEAARARRQRELELEVVRGTVRGWEGETIDQLGEIIKLGGVVLGQAGTKKDKYLVLFPATLLILSASNRLSAFIYEGKLPLSGLCLARADPESDTTFNISGPLTEPLQCVFPSKTECAAWWAALSAAVRASRQSAVLPGKLPGLQPAPPPHAGAGAGGSPGGAGRSPRPGLASRAAPGQGGVQGWKMTCLRPAPPTRAFFQADKRNTLRRKEVEQSSYEDDLQILRVIEAYCTSKQRQTITNSALLDPAPLLSLADELSGSPAPRPASSRQSSATGLGKVAALEQTVAGLGRRLESEIQTRRRLQEILQQSGINIPAELTTAE